MWYCIFFFFLFFLRFCSGIDTFISSRQRGNMGERGPESNRGSAAFMACALTTCPVLYFNIHKNACVSKLSKIVFTSSSLVWRF